MKLRETAPEGMMEWARAQCAWPEYLIYKAGWLRDWVTGIRERCADAVCTACGSSMKLDYRYNGKGNSPRFALYDGLEYRDYGPYDEVYCPDCGMKLLAMHTSSMRQDLCRVIWPFSMERQGDSVIVYLWKIMRETGTDGRHRWRTMPWEAYVFEGKRAIRWKHWSTYYFGVTRYSDTWIETKKVQDTAGDAELFWQKDRIAEITEGTALENSKLELYMNCQTAKPFPITWLRLYQKHPKAETLMTWSAAEAVAQIIEKEKRERASDYRAWNNSTNVLDWLDWKQKRPSAMLRIGKEEVPYFSPQKEQAGARLKAVSLLRKDGYTIQCGEESTEKLDNQRAVLVWGLTPARVQAYLTQERSGYITLRDYWSMAEKLGNPLREKRELLPKNLKEAHDRCALRMKEQKLEHLKEKFEKRYREMSRYCWEKDGILIRPVATPAELIKEGERLHHCVAEYAEKHAAGETTIFLVRRAEAPEEPWYTLEFDKKKKTVRQNRGAHNCPRTKEVTAFEEAWLKWVRGGSKQKKEKKAA